jgi:hypothetical protein
VAFLQDSSGCSRKEYAARVEDGASCRDAGVAKVPMARATEPASLLNVILFVKSVLIRN